MIRSGKDEHAQSKRDFDEEQFPNNDVSAKATTKTQEIQIIQMRNDEGEAEEDGARPRRQTILQQRVDEEREKVGIEMTVETLKDVHGREPEEVSLTEKLPEECAERRGGGNAGRGGRGCRRRRGWK